MSRRLIRIDPRLLLGGRINTEGRSRSRPAPTSPSGLPEQAMNRTESRYAELLELRRRAGELERFSFEGVSIRLAHRTWYRFDFLVVPAGGRRCEIHEVKGHWEDDARVKIKVAASLHPQWTFYAVRLVGRGRRATWETERIRVR
jgi:hypothetical protein